MTMQHQLVSYKYGVRDVAIDGLWRGALAGTVMALYLVIVTIALGNDPLSLLANFTAQEVEVSPLVGALSHLAASSIYGVLFAILWHVLARRSGHKIWVVLAGLGYATLLFIFSELVLLPAVQSPLLDLPVLHWGIGHLIYGLVLGGLTAHGHRA